MEGVAFIDFPIRTHQHAYYMLAARALKVKYKFMCNPLRKTQDTFLDYYSS